MENPRFPLAWPLHGSLGIHHRWAPTGDPPSVFARVGSTHPGFDIRPVSRYTLRRSIRQIDRQMDRLKLPRKPRKLYRVKFLEKGEDQPLTVTVGGFTPSEYLGLVTLSDFVFIDETKLVVLPGDDEVRKRFAKTERLHLPYHVLLSVEEFLEGEEDVRHIPYLREVDEDPAPES